ncbi:MAG: RNA polymerase sigma factor [Planctomycetota bacterium]|jgi:RNA polymerase sigma-70 factor (ECF subfamily)
MPDGSVIDRARAGDDDAWERLVARWDGEVLNLAYRLTGDREEARDIRQKAFVRAYAGLDRFDGRSRFSTWLYRIVVNLCRDQLRRSRRLPAARPGDDAPRAAAAPSEQAARAELAARVAAAVTDLPAGEREVLVLRHYHQLALVDVARVLGVPPTTARSRLARALERLRETLALTESSPCLE